MIKVIVRVLLTMTAARSQFKFCIKSIFLFPGLKNHVKQKTAKESLTLTSSNTQRPLKTSKINMFVMRIQLTALFVKITCIKGR